MAKLYFLIIVFLTFYIKKANRIPNYSGDCNLFHFYFTLKIASYYETIPKISIRHEYIPISYTFSLFTLYLNSNNDKFIINLNGKIILLMIFKNVFLNKPMKYI